MKFLNYPIIVLAFLALTIGACTKEPLNNLTEEESRIYITHRDSTINFATYKTFSVADSIGIVDNGQLAGRDRTDFDAQFIAAVRTVMQQRGFQMVDRTENPDIGINISRVYNTYSGLIDYSNYWGGYGGFYDPFYWGYGGSPYYFPPMYGVYEVTEGAISIDLIDLMNADTNGNLSGIWNGLVRGTGIFRANTAPGSVTALFDQSPYLQTN